ncbi:SDR family NAD(P)-dependent oxidoreductase [Nonomuraea jiangxiensis]|uniref:2-deoxy-D-gluconate 3-dehydrogenase n=1 Tax=Nonomuraea jiangxiensis TaxID=633440 RepID=A0A1G9WAM7_9ACTN|nr:SDR family oxidoreductase [Nonomuraea jiangxiensis]SDM81055.1 2-deoxy-D-gluconate 3-dehydrogenase [Nonomuraea jiangxiensis]
MVVVTGAYLDIFSLAGKRAIVTGAGRGIGRAIAAGVAGAGANVALVSRGTAQLEETQALIAEAGGTSQVVAADLSSTEEVIRLADAAEAALGGPIDIVVHSAGTQHREAALTFPLDAWDRVIQVNLTAPFLLSQEIGRRQIAANRPGNHVFVASLTSILGLPNLVAYNAAKSGLMGVVRALSREWAAQGIRVNGISPGYVETAMTKDLFADPERRQKLLDRIPTGRFGTTEELAAPTVFLASDASAYMTGQLLIIDGGWAGA